MGWNPWIKIEPDDSSNPEAKELYQSTQNKLTGHISDLTRITSLTPKVAKHIDDLCQAVYTGATGFSEKEKEIIALVTSSLIGCVH